VGGRLRPTIRFNGLLNQAAGAAVAELGVCPVFWKNDLRLIM